MSRTASWRRRGLFIVVVAPAATTLVAVGLGAELPQARAALPSVTTPALSTPSLATPTVTVPSITVPSIAVPAQAPGSALPPAPAPSVPAPAPTPAVPPLPAPSVPAPSLPAPSPAAPSVPPTPSRPATPSTPSTPSSAPALPPAPASAPGRAAPSSSASAPSSAGASSPANGTSAGSPAGASSGSSTSSPSPASGDRASGGSAQRAATTRGHATPLSTTTLRIPRLGVKASPRQVRRILRVLGGCVSRLPDRARSLLLERAGADGSAESLSSLSRRLGTSRTAVEARIRRAARRLGELARTTGCAGAASASTAPSGDDTVAVPITETSSPPTGASAGGAGGSTPVIRAEAESRDDAGPAAGGDRDRPLEPLADLVVGRDIPLWLVALCALAIVAGLATVGGEFRDVLVPEVHRRRGRAVRDRWRAARSSLADRARRLW
jgi:hypothetical protein